MKQTLQEYVEKNSRTTTAGKRKIVSFTAKDFLELEQPDREWLLEPLMKQYSSVMLYADAGVGKTFLTWEMITTVAGGGSFAGWIAPKPRRVLVLDGEMQANELRERLTGTLERQEGKSVLTALENITVIPRQAQHYKTAFYNLDKPDYQEMVLDELNRAKTAGRPYELLVLDNFSCLADVEDENSSSAFNGICQFLNRAKTMTTVLLVHHTKKNSGKQSVESEGMTYRGSSKLGGIMEICIGLSRPATADRPQHSAACFQFKLEKYRGLKSKETDPRIFSLNPEAGQWDIYESSNDQFTKYSDALKSLKYVNADAVGEALGLDRSTAYRNIKKMIESGAMSRDEVGECYNRAKRLRELEAMSDEELIAADGQLEQAENNSDY